jgi:hypothetical protein
MTSQVRGTSVIGIYGEQGVQTVVPLRGKPDDEERFVNFLSHDAWIHLPDPVA